MSTAQFNSVDEDQGTSAATGGGEARDARSAVRHSNEEVRWTYLDTGEVYELTEDDELGECICDLGEPNDETGPLLAAAPTLLRAARAAQEGIRQLLRNHIASIPNEAALAEQLLQDAIDQAEGA